MLIGIGTNMLGNNQVDQLKPILTGEDFSYHSLNKLIPNFYFEIGSTDSIKFYVCKRTGIPLPPNHSQYMMPVPATTIKTGVIAITSTAMKSLKNSG